MTTKIKIQLGLIVFMAVFALSLIIAQGASPDAVPFFALKRVQEKVFLNFKSSPQEKVDYMRGLLNNRLAELKSQVNRKSYGYILPSSLRYSTLAGQITEMVMENNMGDQLKDIKAQFVNHQKVLMEIYIIYPKNTENMEYKYIEDDINYLKIYLDKLGE